MNSRKLITRSLWHYRRTGVVVAFGIAVATAVIVGSLLTGDSVKGSIRDAALARLGKADYALVAPHFFRDRLADDLSRRGGIRNAVPLIVTRGTARNLSTDAAAPSVSVIGIDSRFGKLYQTPFPPLTGRQVAASESLARDLVLRVGDSILVNVDRQSAIPSGTLFAHRSREDTLRSMRLTVHAILPDVGAGGFKLDAGADAPRNIFISREWLTQQIGKEHKANALLVESDAHGSILQVALASTCTLADYGLKLVPNAKQGYVALQTDSLLLNEKQVKAARQSARLIGARSALTSVYLATDIRKQSGGVGIPYSVVAAAEPLSAPPLLTKEGSGEVDPTGIWLNTWAADDIAAKIGDKLRVTYLIPNPDGTYRNGKKEFTLRGVVELAGAADDRGLVPIFEGITDADRIDEWSAPFPIDLHRIRPKDEAYWDKYRATPKALISLQAAQELWNTASPEGNASWVTSVRLQPKPGSNPAALERDFSREMLKRISPEESGMVFRPIRKLALASSAGTTDFAGLFLSMSFFLVLAGAGLAGMLMRLSADRRASEAGIMMACGFDAKRAGRVILGEGIALTLAGVLVGVPLGIIYAWAVISALTRWWVGAVGTSALWLHVTPESVIAGAGGGLLVGVASVAWGARRLARGRVLDLLAGWQSMSVLPTKSGGRRIKAVLFALIALAAMVLVLSMVKAIQPQATFFGCGASLLLAGLAAVDLVLIRALDVTTLRPTIPWLALRSAAANRGRSLLVIGLLASASFIIVAVAANTRDYSHADFTRRDFGTGGFALKAVSSLPIHYDLRSPTGRNILGFQSDDEAAFRGVRIMPFLMSPGEDISCLNIARASRPRVLGVSPEMIRRGGFSMLTRKAGGNSWRLLERTGRDGSIPAFADADSVKWNLHLDLGKTYTLPGEDGKPVTIQFVGLVRGSVFASEILVSEANFKRIFPSVTQPRYFLIDAPPDKADKLARSLRENLGDMGLEVRTTREVLNAFLSVQNTYLSVFLALGGLGVLLGTVGMVAVLLRGALERKREFALMLATGTTRHALRRLLIIENAGLLVSGLLCGTISALVAVAPQVASVESRVNWPTIAGMLFAILAVGLISCAFAAGSVVKGSLTQALREE